MHFIYHKIIQKIKEDRELGTIFLANTLLSFHYYLIIYINSSFLSRFFSASQISVLYIIGSLATLILLVNIAKVLEKIGNYKLIMYLIIAEMVAAFGMAFAISPTMIALYFIIYLIAVPTISFGFDLLLESVIADETKTGEIRTTYLTLANITIILSTLIVAAVLTDGDYYKIYLTSLLFLIPLYILMKKKFHSYQDGTINHINIKEAWRAHTQNKDIYNVSVVHLCLQIFYAYMVIYTPIYLSQYIGFSWQDIGVMFSIILLPFIIFELPTGWLADKKFGEKEMMTIGLICMGIFTLLIAFITIKSFLLWTAVLFMTRAGASIVEATVDSYFFKKVNKDDADAIAFFRLGGPASFIIAPIIATLSLQFLAYSHIFIIVGTLLIIGCHYSLSLRDTL